MEGDTGQAVLTSEDAEPLLFPKEPLQRLSPQRLHMHGSAAFGTSPLPVFLTAHLIGDLPRSRQSTDGMDCSQI